MKLIVGLGNPGNEYTRTRHNIGFMALDAVSKKYDLEFKLKKFDGLYDEKIINGEKLIFLKPQKYMNLSGEVIKKFVDYFDIDVSDVLIICDDLDTKLGEYKLRFKGGNAGHNGLKNIEENLKTNEYKRLKIGISKQNDYDTKNYVLGKFSADDLNKIEPIMESMPKIIDDYLMLSFDNVMNKYN